MPAPYGRIGRAEAPWHDMSEHVVHIVGGQTSAQAYDGIISILDKGTLMAGRPFGAGKVAAPDKASQRTVCFSEIPVDLILRLIARRLPRDRSSWHGIAFTKAFLVENGGGPVMYVYDGTPQADALGALMARARRSDEPSADPIWRLAPFIDVAGRSGPDGAYLFEWEREWRHVGDLRFRPEDVAYLVMPEEFHEAARGFFDDARRDRTGPAYDCPFIDATWSRDRCRQALADDPRPG